MNNITKNILFAIVGLLTGILLMGILSQRASNTYLEVLQLNYNWEQQVAAAQALEDQNFTIAVHHYRNLVESSSNSIQVFEEAKGAWTWSFPFASEILIRMKAHVSDPKGIVKKRDVGLNRGRLAYALEKNNMQDQANIEWQKAMELLEMESIERVRSFIERINKTETAILSESTLVAE